MSGTNLSQPAFRARMALAHEPGRLVNLDFLFWRQASFSAINNPSLPAAHQPHRLDSPWRQLRLVILTVHKMPVWSSGPWFIDFPRGHSDSLILSGPYSLYPGITFQFRILGHFIFSLGW